MSNKAGSKLLNGNANVQSSSSTAPSCVLQGVPMNCCSNSMVKSPNKYDTVFIYDLDVLTLLSRERMENIERNCPNSQESILVKIVKAILAKCKFEETSDRDNMIMNIENVGDAGEAAAKYEAIKQLYQDNAYEMKKKNKKKLDISSQFPEAHFLTGRWSYSRRSLRMLNKKSKESQNQKYANLVLCQDGIQDGFAQLIVSQMSSEVLAENFYSRSGTSAKTVLEMIRKKLGDQCRIIIIASEVETISAAKELSFPVFCVHGIGHFKDLYALQRDVWLSEDEFPISSELQIEQMKQQQGKEKEKEALTQDLIKNNECCVQTQLRETYAIMIAKSEEVDRIHMLLLSGDFRPDSEPQQVLDEEIATEKPNHLQQIQSQKPSRQELEKSLSQAQCARDQAVALYKMTLAWDQSMAQPQQEVVYQRLHQQQFTQSHLPLQDEEEPSPKKRKQQAKDFYIQYIHNEEKC